MSGEEMNNQSVDELREMEERALDIKIVAALERAPEVSQLIPADFAARVAASVPSRRAVAVSAFALGANDDVGVARCVAGCSCVCGGCEG